MRYAPTRSITEPRSGYAFLRWRMALRIATRIPRRASIHIMRTAALIFAPALLLGSLPLCAQNDASTIKVDVDVVNILFNVRDKKGGLIGNLEKGDFSIWEDGKQQEIKYFNRETDLPLTIGLLVDVSSSQMNLIDIEKNAADQFFSNVIRPKDLAFLISFGADADLLQDYTSSPKLLRKGLEDLHVNSGVGGVTPGPVPTAGQPRGTILYDAVYLAAHDQLKGQVGRKVLVLITDGEDQGSRYTIKQAIEAAQKADAMVYSFFYVDRDFYRQYGIMFGGGNAGALKQMSDETGGQVFRIDRKLTLQAAFDELNAEMRSQYAIGYVPTNPAKDGT